MPITAPCQRRDSVMVAIAPLAPVRPEHADGLRRLEKIIRCYHGFQLILALYNDPPDYRNWLIEHVNGLVDQTDRLDTRTCADFLEFELRLASACADSELVHVVGLDAWLREKAGEQRLQGFNLHRETLALDCPKLIVLWLTVHLTGQFALQAPDVWEWRRAVLDFSTEGELPESFPESLSWMAEVGKQEIQADGNIFEDDDRVWTHSLFTSQASQIEQLKYSGNMAAALKSAKNLYERANAKGENAYPEATVDIALACLLLGGAYSRAGNSDLAITWLKKAQERFEQIEQNYTFAKRLVAVALKEQGDSLRWLGRYEQAAAAYKRSKERAEQINDMELIAVAKMQLGTVRICQKRYREALSDFTEAKEFFDKHDNRQNSAGVLHLLGIVYMETRRFEDAETIFMDSLDRMRQLFNVGGEAKVLFELGNLYYGMNRIKEDAVVAYRQSLGKFLEIGDTFREGMVRCNLTLSLLKLRQTADARAEIRPAIRINEQYDNAAKPWNVWGILSEIETIDGSLQAAKEARQKALELFLAYRRDGGENHKYSGSLCKAIGKALLEKNTGEAQGLLAEWRINPAWMQEGKPEPLLHALTEIIDGKRDLSLADSPDLTYDQAAEITLLLEALKASA